MIDKNHVLNTLKANGIVPPANDEEVRSMLLSARWTDNEVDAALMILKQNTTNQTTHIDTLHKVFRSDERLTPSEVTSLLGIDVHIDEADVVDLVAERRRVEKASSRIAIVLSILIAIASVGYVMYREQAGFFHPSVMQAHE